MRLIRFRHKGLRQLYAKDDPKGLSTSLVDKVRKLLFALETANTLEQVGRFPGWKLHPLKGDLKGFRSLNGYRKLARCFPLQRNDQHRQRHRFHRLPLGAQT